MDQDRQRRRDELLEVLLDLEPAARAEYLATACEHDPELRADVEQILAMEAQVDADFLEAGAAPAAPPPLSAGTHLGRFVIEGVIGAGGMSTVYLAQDPIVGRKVAIKVMSASHDDAWRDRFFRELRILGGIRHDHVVGVYDFGETPDGQPYLVMEHLEGESLATAIAKDHCGDTTRKVAIVRQIAVALRDLHRLGVVHRDLKPANVVLDASGRVKLIDFGIARTDRAADTHVGLLRGTPEYMAPERIQGGEATPRVDVYAYGVLLFELFSGRRPFSGDTQDVLRRTVHEPMPMQALRGRAPRHLISLIEQATSKAPDDRPPDFDQIVLALDRRPRRHAMVGAVVLAAAAVAVVLVGIATFRGSDGTPVASARTGAERAPAATGDSIAVLPFQTAGQDSDVAYVADGLVESVTNTLTRIRTVRVIASATAFGYRGRTDVQAIGRALNVRTLVMGRLSRIRDSFRVQAELVDTGSGTQLWGQQYQGSEDDLLQFHDDLALRVSQHLRSDTSHAEEPPWRSTQNPRAFQLYLKGRYSLAQASVPEIQKAIGLFHQALEVDPVYAVAYSGLADSYIGLSGNFLTPKDAMSKAKAAALRALDLDPNVPEAHISLGIVRGYFDFDWAASTDSFKRAITLQPTNASSHLWYAWNLLLTGDANEALDQAQRAQELDPLSAYIEVGAGQMHYYAGRTDAAVQRLERAVQSRPDLFIGRYYLGVAYLQANRLADAVRELESARRLDPQQPQPLGYLAFAYAQNGDRERAGQRLEQLQRLAASRYVSDYLFAIAAAGMGARDEVVRRLERAYEQHDDMLSVLGVDRPFTVLRTDPRVRALIFRLGIA